MKFFFRLLLSLCFFLSDGLGHVNARTGERDNYYASLKNSESSPRVDHCAVRRVFVRAADPVKEKESGDVEATTTENREEDENEEDDEDKLTSGKKHINLGSYFTTFLYVQNPESLSGCNQQYLLFSSDSTYTSSRRHIFFGVFRI